MAPPTAVPQNHPPLTGISLVLATISLSLATFMNVLDTTIANVSIPTIAGNFSVSPNQGTWVITSYAVAAGVVVPLTGWLAKRLGEVGLFVFCTALFSVMSWLCGFARDFNVLVILRALQGMTAGPMRLAQGLGMAMFFIPLTTISLAGLPPERIASAAGLTNFSRILAGSFGTSLVVTLWEDRTTYHRAVLLEGINMHNPLAAEALQNMANNGMTREAALRTMDMTVSGQAAMLATNDVFYLAAAIFICLMFVIWLADKSPKPAGAGK
ncbi:MAG: MFS transporter [Nitrospinae bacterium]|nr:MFS transporter [Nitrospinota bacterium]